MKPRGTFSVVATRMFLFRFAGPQEQEVQGPLPTHRNNFWRAKAEDHLPAQIRQRCPNNHRMANMKSRKKPAKKRLTEEEIDKIVVSQADKDSAWEKPIEVRTARSASLSIPAELSARAAFLAKLHRERNLEDWLTRVIKERVELEEVAFHEAKREMSLRNGA
jgi:hypothetical protein